MDPILEWEEKMKTSAQDFRLKSSFILQCDKPIADGASKTPQFLANANTIIGYVSDDAAKPDKCGQADQKQQTENCKGG